MKAPGLRAPRPSSSSSSARGRRGRASSPTPRISRSRRRSSRRVDGLPLAIELAAARVNVLGLAEIVSILERRAAFLRDTPATDPGRIALQGLVEWSYDLLHGDEKTLLQRLAVHRGGASLASLVAVAATDGLSQATVAYLVAALVDKSVVSASFSGGVARYDMLDTVREYVLERLAESGGLAAARAAHADYFATLADDARPHLRGPDWLRCQSRLALENDNLWAALAYARDAPDPGVAIRLGTLAWYFGLAGRVAEGRRFLDLALAATRDDAPVQLRVELLAGLCYLATEELDLDAALAAGERALALAATAAAPRQLGLAQLTLALALAQSGVGERAEAMAGDASATFEAAGDDWGVAASSIIRAAAAARDGDVAAVAAMAAAIHRHSDAIGYDAFRVPGLLLEAWVAERRQDGAAAIEGYRRALELAGRVGFGEHAAFALAGLGSIAFAKGDLARGRGAPAAGTGHRRGGPSAVGRGPCRRPARPHRCGARRCAHRRAAVPPGPRAVADRSGRARRARSSSPPSPTARPRQRCSGSPSWPTPGATPPRPTSCASAPASRSPELAEPPPRLAERWHRGPRTFALPHNTNRRLDLSTTTITIEDELAEVRRRINCMQVCAQACGLPRVRRHLDALQHEEASVRAAARQAPGEVEDKLGQLRTRVDIAEHSLTADLSGDWPTFVAAVEAELDSWDTYLERLQTSVATRAWEARAQAETAIAEVRTRRIAVDEHLAHARERTGDTWQEQRARVTVARDELEEKTDELSTKLN